MGKLMKLMWLATKTGICAGSVYVTVDQGVWGSPTETAKLYTQLYETIPGLKTFREEYISDWIPKTSTNFNFRDSWNSGVLSTFSFIADSPAKACDFTSYVVQSVSTLMEEQTQTPTQQKET